MYFFHHFFCNRFNVIIIHPEIHVLACSWVKGSMSETQKHQEPLLSCFQMPELSRPTLFRIQMNWLRQLGFIKCSLSLEKCHHTACSLVNYHITCTAVRLFILKLTMPWNIICDFLINSLTTSFSSVNVCLNLLHIVTSCF